MTAAARLTRAVLLIEELRKIDQEMPAQTALVFLPIARDEGITRTEAMRRLGVAKSSIQRIFSRLSAAGDGGKPGHDLIEVRVSPADARARQAYVAPKGRRFAQSLLRRMEG